MSKSFPIISKSHYSPINTNKALKNLIDKVAELNATFMKEAMAQLENGNKAAGTRARKVSHELEKAMKEFRKLSLEASKQ